MTAAPAASAEHGPVARLRVAIACLLLVALSFSQSPGLLVPDTKLDLAVAPLRFLDRALHLWDPQGAFGQLQNQAYGYLFPMGPFFALGELLAVPGWVVQRGWLALVLCTALLGAHRLARELGIGTPGTQLLAGLAYAVSPRVLTVGGPISIEAWPLALLPWVLVPLVRGARGGSERRAAAWSGVAVLCIGGVNAAATLAVLPLAGLFLLTRLGSARGRRLAAWWALFVPLATLWWVLPLLLLGRYSLPFLDYIETAATTTARTSLVEVLRGTSHWLAYVSVGDGPWWRAGWDLVSSPVLVVATAVVAALGLAGLVRRDMPERTFLLSGVLLGTLLVTAGHVGSLPGWLTPPLAEPLRDLLDGPLAPFRNVHKFDAVLRLPLVLGLAHLATQVRTRPLPELGPTLQPAVTRPVAVLAGLALLVSATPLLTARLAPDGSFAGLPSSWENAAAWLAEREPRGRALLVPGGPFGEYVWGRPLDEPLQPLADAPWAVRNAVPLGSEGNTRLLDAIEEQLDAGKASPGLAPLLTRAGVTHLVVRHDLDWLNVGAPPPVVVEQALTASPGIVGVAAFSAIDPRIPALTVFEVVDTPASPVRTYPADELVRLSGGPASLLHVGDLDPDLLRDRPVVLAGEATQTPVDAVVVTDDARRREVDFGRTRDGSSATLSFDDPLRLDRPAADLVVVPGGEHLTTAVYDGVRAVRASSSTGDAGTFGGTDRQRLPYAAFDGDEDTAWLPGSVAAEGQWVELVLDAPQEVREVDLLPLVEGGEQVSATVRVTTDAGEVEQRLTRARQTIALPEGPTDRVRLTVTELGGEALRVGFREVVVPGVQVQRVLAAPADAAQAPDVPVSVALTRTRDSRDACVPTPDGPVCAEGLRRVGEEPGDLERSFTTVAPAQVELELTGRPVPGPALSARLAEARGGALRAEADVSAFAAPVASPAAVVDVDYRTAWIATGEEPSLALSWDEPREVSRLFLSADLPFDEQGPGPLRLTASLDGEDLPLFAQPSPDPEGGGVLFGPVLADRLVLHFSPDDEELRVNEVYLPDLDDLHEAVRPPLVVPVEVPCGEGPRVVVDGRVIETSIGAPYIALARLRPVELTPCLEEPVLALEAGEHRLSGRSTDAVRVDGVLLRDVEMDSQPQGDERVVEEVLEWGETTRRVALTAGEPTYLAVKENANAGWSATLDGQPLAAQRLDGWQQAFLVPAGAAGTVELVYTPDAPFRLGLLAGLVAALALVAVALVPARRPAPRPPAPAPQRVLAAGALAAVALVLLGGPAGVLALLVGLLVWRRGRVSAVVATSVVAAGALVALRPWPSPSAGADAVLPQLLALLALGVAAVALLPPARRVARPAGEPAVDQA